MAKHDDAREAELDAREIELKDRENAALKQERDAKKPPPERMTMAVPGIARLEARREYWWRNKDAGYGYYKKGWNLWTPAKVTVTVGDEPHKMEAHEFNDFVSTLVHFRAALTRWNKTGCGGRNDGET